MAQRLLIYELKQGEKDELYYLRQTNLGKIGILLCARRLLLPGMF